MFSPPRFSVTTFFTLIASLGLISCGGSSSDSNEAPQSEFSTITLTPSGDMPYVVDIEYNGEKQSVQHDAVQFEYAPSNHEIKINKVNGPQVCTISEEGAAAKLKCLGLSLAYGKTIPEIPSRNLHQFYGREEASLNWPYLEDELIQQDYVWFDEAMWIRSVHQTENRQYVYQLPIVNGQVSDSIRHDVKAESIINYQGALWAFLGPDGLDATGYEILEFNAADKTWERVSISETYNLSNLQLSDNELSWHLTNPDTPNKKFLGRTQEGEIKNIKALSDSITLFDHSPVFHYDSQGLLPVEKNNELLVSFLSVADPELALYNIGAATSHNIWRHENNSYLFYTLDDQVQQLSFLRDGVPTSTAFDLSVVNNENVNWVGGDEALFLAGNKIAENEYQLKFLKSSISHRVESELKDLLFTQSYILLKNARSTQGHILAFVGSKARGHIWVIGDNSYYLLNFKAISWEQFREGEYSFETITPHHIIVSTPSTGIINIKRHR